MACRADFSPQSVSCAETTTISVSSLVHAVKPLQFRLLPEESSPNHTIVIGSPLYWHNICGSVRNVLDRFYGKVEDGELSGRKLYFVFQGAAPEQWMLDAGEYTMKRFAGLYGMTYGGMATNKNEATKLGKNI